MAPHPALLPAVTENPGAPISGLHQYFFPSPVLLAGRAHTLEQGRIPFLGSILTALFPGPLDQVWIGAAAGDAIEKALLGLLLDSFLILHSHALSFTRGCDRPEALIGRNRLAGPLGDLRADVWTQYNGSFIIFLADYYPGQC